MRLQYFYFLLKDLLQNISSLKISLKEDPSGFLKFFVSFFSPLGGWFYPSVARSTPAATAEPITPETLGPIACIRRKF